MKFLVDHARSPELARLLRDAGYGAIHVRDYGTSGSRRPVERAHAEDRILISADSDFAMVLATPRRLKRSFVLFREPDITCPADYASTILMNLPAIEHGLLARCVATIRRGRVRVRTLPIGGPQQ